MIKLALYHFILLFILVYIATPIHISSPVYAAQGANKTANQKNAVFKIIKPLSFSLPLDCVPSQDCWIMNYVDFTPDDGKQTDPHCLSRTYDGHKGTDFALRDGKSMAGGVDVLAAADGTISKIRDGEPDLWASTQELEAIKTARKECGNAILIDHGNARQTIYCHLKNGSITVRKGQKVKRGEKIAQVGLSGFTQFPHLHFGVLWEGAIIDPFTGQTNTGTCNTPKQSYWDEQTRETLQLDYQPLIIQGLGFRDTPPTLSQIERDATPPETISATADILAVWVTLLGVRTGDEITLEIRDPNNKVFVRRDITQDKIRARQFYYTGRKLNGRTLTEGAYSATVKVTRKSDEENPAPPLQKTATTAILITP